MLVVPHGADRTGSGHVGFRTRQGIRASKANSELHATGVVAGGAWAYTIDRIPIRRLCAVSRYRAGRNTKHKHAEPGSNQRGFLHGFPLIGGLRGSLYSIKIGLRGREVK